MSHLMSDPVRLPNSLQIVDRSTIARHLLSDQTDPFTRAPLTMDQVEPLGMISHKKSIITIFGHKHKIKNFIFFMKNFNSLQFWFIFGIQLRIKITLKMINEF